MENAKSVVNVLKKAKAKISNGWCQGALARDSDECDVDLDDFSERQRAEMVCSIGGIYFATQDDTLRVKAENALCNVIKCGDVVDWNDSPHQRKDRVLAGFDRAIARLSK